MQPELPPTTPEDIKCAEQEWDSYKSVLCEGEEINMQRVKLAISSFLGIARGVSRVYAEVTGGLINDSCAEPEDVIQAYRKHLLTMLGRESKTTQ